MRLSESAAEIHAADVVAQKDFVFLHEAAKSGHRLTNEERTAIVRNRGLIAKMCVRATQRLVQMMGGLRPHRQQPGATALSAMSKGWRHKSVSRSM